MHFPHDFRELRAQLRTLMRLPPVAKNDVGVLPDAGGVYIFFDGAQPMYVGRTRDEGVLRERVRYQFRGGSESDQSTLARHLPGTDFQAKRAQLSQWQVRALPVECTRTRQRLEAFAILHFNPPFNRG